MSLLKEGFRNLGIKGMAITGSALSLTSLACVGGKAIELSNLPK